MCHKIGFISVLQELVKVLQKQSSAMQSSLFCNFPKYKILKRYIRRTLVLKYLNGLFPKIFPWNNSRNILVRNLPTINCYTQKILAFRVYYFIFFHIACTVQKRSFPLTISSVNMTKSVGNCGFGHITEEILNGRLHFVCSVATGLEVNIKKWNFVAIALELSTYNQWNNVPTTISGLLITSTSSEQSELFLKYIQK